MKPFLVGATAVSIAALIAGCGSNNAAAPSAVSTIPTAAVGGGGNGTGGNGTGGARTPPGAFGIVAAVSGAIVQVQNPQVGQVAVKWTPATVFSETEKAAPSELGVGSCVVIRGTTSGSKSSIVARTIAISAASRGKCSAAMTDGFGGFAGFAGRAGMRGNRGAPATPATPRADRSPRAGGFAGGDSVLGTVSAISGTGFTVHGVVRTFTRGPSGAPPATATPAASVISVATDASTTYTTTAVVSSSAMTVGECVAAVGPADNTGAITAKSVSISQATNGSCFGGFGRRGQSGATDGTTNG